MKRLSCNFIYLLACMSTSSLYLPLSFSLSHSFLSLTLFSLTLLSLSYYFTLLLSPSLSLYVYFTLYFSIPYPISLSFSLSVSLSFSLSIYLSSLHFYYLRSPFLFIFFTYVGTAAFVDAEHALDPVYAKNLGVNVDDLLVCQVRMFDHFLRYCS